MRTQTPVYVPVEDVWIQRSTDLVRQNGMRVTSALRQVLKVLSSADRPLKVEEIRLRGGFVASDLVTIYRNLERLQQAGLIQRIMLEDGVQLFEKSLPHRHHHHIVCRRCCITLPLSSCFGEELEHQAKACGFADISHVIEVFGLCSRCQSESKQEE
jgi:Fur family transcriptional regulator, ferric uptake regulator